MAFVFRYVRQVVTDADEEVDSYPTREASQLIPSASVEDSRDEENQEETYTPLTSRPPLKNYGSAPSTNRMFISETLGFTDLYVDWTHSKESIVHACLAFLLYLGIAILGYSFVFESWNVLDSLYFAVTVFTTVGYGDLAPTSDASRLFTIFFASGGIIILGVFLGIIGTRLFELREARVDEKLESARQKVMNQFSNEMESEPRVQRKFSQDVLEIVRIELPMILVLVLLAIPIVYLEEWDIVMGIYWMFVTGTTIGFGDLRPTHPYTKILSILYVPLAAAVFGEMLAQIAGAYIERRSDEMEDAFLDRALTIGDLEKMDLEKDGKVQPYEFLSYMLVTMQKVDQEEVDEILALFRKLDKGKDGYLNKSDLSKKYSLEVRPGILRTAATRRLDIVPDDD